MASPELISPRGTYRPAPLIEPTSSAYLLITASVELQDRPGPVLHSGARSSVLAVLAGRLDAAAGCSTQLFQAAAFPPFQAVPAGELPGLASHYDVVALITAAPGEAPAAVEAHPSCRDFAAGLRAKSAGFSAARTRNVRRIAAVPPAARQAPPLQLLPLG